MGGQVTDNPYTLEEELARMRAGDNDEAEYRDITRQAKADQRAEAKLEDAPAWAWISLAEAAETATRKRREGKS